MLPFFVHFDFEGKLDECKISSIPSAVDMNIALSCLHQTTPTLKLEYPRDAEAHMNEIRLALAPWAQHVCLFISNIIYA